MPEVSITACICFAVLSAFLLYLSPVQHRWKFLMLTCVLFYGFLSPLSLVVGLSIVLVTYFLSFRQKILKNHFKVLLIFLLLPLLYQKVYLSNQLFTTYRVAQDTDYWLGLLSMSYITFNAIGYLMDVRRKYVVPQENLGKLVLYILYFPITFSGPLTRAQYFFDRVKEITIQRGNLVKGARHILWGSFKNLVVGARLFILLEVLVDMSLSGFWYLLVGLVFFLYLYTTFSSFISIFRGISLVFNIPLEQNFKPRIYLSASREEFWKGWHITLNNWFRDYFFYEIVRWDKKRKFTNLLLFITFLCIALWHNITWVFLVWGTLNATWLIAERKFKKAFPDYRSPRILGTAYHLAISCVLATVFIAQDVQGLWNSYFEGDKTDVDLRQLLMFNSVILVLSFGFMDYIERQTREIEIHQYLDQLNLFKRFSWYYLVIAATLFLKGNDELSNYYNLF